MKKFSALTITILSLVSPLMGQTLLNDTFADNSRTNQALTASSAWFLLSATGATGPTSATSSNLSGASGALVFTALPTPLTANLVTFFTASGSPRVLADGETISVNFSLTLSSINSSTAANTIRFGLFNSTATRVTADSVGLGSNFTSSTFSNDGGYQIGFNPGSTATLVSVNERNAASVDASNTALFSSNAATTTSIATSSLAIGATAATPFSLSLSIARSGTNYNLSSTINGQTISFTDTSISATAFDQFALQYSTNAVGTSGTITLDNLTVTVVPEPSTYALLIGSILMLILVVRRNQIA